MPKDSRANFDIEEGNEAENYASNSMSGAQLRNTLVSSTFTAIQWTAWWAAALATNVAMGALPGAIIGMVCGYAYAEWNEPCIEEKNSVAVRKCALRSPDIGYGALYGASTTGLIGVGVTAYGFFKNPSIRGAKDTMSLTSIAAGYCCVAIFKSIGD